MVAGGCDEPFSNESTLTSSRSVTITSTSFLTALSIAGASVKDHAVPAKYGEETSNVKLLSTALRNLWAVWVGFWQRIYYKYVLFSFHPIALLLFCGLTLVALGTGFSIFILVVRIGENLSSSTGTVMLAVLPRILHSSSCLYGLD